MILNMLVHGKGPMDREINRIEPEDLPFNFEGIDDYGEIFYAELECPGVYYIAIEIRDEMVAFAEYYVITKEAQAISGEARRYGQQLQERPNLLLYRYGEDSSGWMIIRYEIYKYLTAHGVVLPGGDSLCEAAYCGMELHPEYFGEFPVPALTPLGNTTRHRRIDNGIYWIETDQCSQLLAVCQLLCEGLSEAARKLELNVEDEMKKRIDPIARYLFFPQEQYAIPLFELMEAYQWSARIDKAALMNAIWLNFPEYAASYNMNEHTAQANGLTLVFEDLDLYEQEVSPQNMISYTPNAGTEFLKW